MEHNKATRTARREVRQVLVRAPHTDASGRMWVVHVPVGREWDVVRGIPVGPPETSTLGLPEAIDVRLNNELYRRGLITKADLRGRASEVFAALQAALKVDTAAVMNLYQ